jgi:hypothetical protein
MININKYNKCILKYTFSINLIKCTNYVNLTFNLQGGGAADAEIASSRNPHSSSDDSAVSSSIGPKMLECEKDKHISQM